MNTINTTLKFTSKPNIEGIKNCILKGNTNISNFNITSHKNLDGQIVNCVLKKHTNYMRVCKQLWTQPKEVVQKELKNFYVSIVKMDPSLMDQAKFGFARHMAMYKENYKKALKG